VTHISDNDPVARLMNKRVQKTAGYNVQIVVDAKHILLVADDVVQDGNDLKQLHPMFRLAKAALAVEQLEGLAEQGILVPHKSRRANRIISLCMSLNPRIAGSNDKQGVLLRTVFRMIRKRTPTVVPQTKF
jgi:hypothetical protein